MKNQKKLNRSLFAVTVVVYLLALLSYGFWDYSYNKKIIIRNIDTKLYNSAVSLKYILPDDLHDRAINENAIPVEEDLYLAKKLTRYLKETGLLYTYTIIKDNNKLFFVASDIVADSETERGTFYYYPYEEADGSFKEIFDQEKPIYKTVSDQWGMVRTVIVPEVSPRGVKYLACADYDISYVKSLLKRSMLRTVVSILVLFLLFIPVIFFFTKTQADYLHDITQSKNYIENIVKSIGDGVISTNTKGQITKLNPVAELLAHRKLEDATGKTVREVFVTPSHKAEDPFSKLIQRILKHGKAVELDSLITLISPQGTEYQVSVNASPIFDNNDTVNGVVMLLRDVTEDYRMRQALKKSEKRYRTLFEKSTDAIFIVDKQSGKYVDANEATTRLTGREVSELQQLTMNDVSVGGARDGLKVTAEYKDVKNFGRVTFVQPEGAQRVAVVRSIPLDNESTIGIAHDITEELAIEEKLRQAQKMEAIGTLAGGIAHDFNNILTAILGYSELALTEIPADAPLRSKIEAIHSSGKRARELVSQILSVSRKDELVMLSLDLRAVVQDALIILRPAIPASVEILTQLSSPCHILGDQTGIHQVVMNLCTNAYQAMQETGGTLRISLSQVNLEGRDAALAQLPAGSYGKLTISDTGLGIPPEHTAHIFNPYFTTKEKGKGTGLGLAAVHGIIQSHSGAIFVESLVKKGTRFDVYLPLTYEISAPDKQIDTQILRGDERILLVDDEQDILKLVKEMLEKHGYNVTVASEAIGALKLFIGHKKDFDLVITDMTMPNMTGDKFARELLGICPDLPIILCTGYSEMISRTEAKNMGISGFLMKPVAMKDLSVEIRKVLDNKNAAG